MHATRNSLAQSDPVAWLKHDHDVIREGLAELRRASPASRSAAMDHVEHVLALHNAIEESVVYPTLASSAERRGEAMELYHQTAEADIIMHEVKKAHEHREEAVVREELDKLITAIDEHIRLEETRAFPLLEELSHDELREMAAHIIAFKETVTTPH